MVRFAECDEMYNDEAICFDATLVWGEEMLIYWPWTTDWAWCDEQEYSEAGLHQCRWLSTECMFALDDEGLCDVNVADVIAEYYSYCPSGDGEVSDCREHMNAYGVEWHSEWWPFSAKEEYVYDDYLNDYVDAGYGQYSGTKGPKNQGGYTYYNDYGSYTGYTD